jgi:hypothetical protein
MSEYHDPAWVVRCAWSVCPLSTLQDVVNSTIAELYRLEPHQLLGRDVSHEQSAHSPIAEALKACSEELRDESGMPDSHAQRATHCELVRGYKRHQSTTWGATFEEALDKYRRAASKTLKASLDAA